MTEKEAYDIIRDPYDDEMLPGGITAEELFLAIYDREPDEDEQEMLWSLCCSATPGLCGCSTRTDHDRGNCTKPRRRGTHQD